MFQTLTYDVFTDTALCGNPLAILPDAAKLPEARLQPIAREFNLSETVFVFPPRTPEHTAHLRIFTPTQEIPFAGHPVIGTAVALAELGAPSRMVLELGSGTVECFAQDGRAAFTTAAPLQVLHRPEVALVARCLGLPMTAVKPGPVIASVGLPFVLVEIDTPAFLERASPDLDAFRDAARRYPLPFDFAIYAYARDGERVEARMFAPLDDIVEDPATGSAAAALGAYLASRGEEPLRLDISQGVLMGRPSRIGVIADRAGVTVSGSAVRVMQGRLMLGGGVSGPVARPSERRPGGPR